MIVVDSITIAIHRDLVDILAGNRFSRTMAPDDSVVKMIAKPNCIGINTIEVKADIVRFNVSAKILLEQYSFGININTIGRVLDMVNKTGIIKLNSNNLSDYQVHKCDFVANFHTDKPHPAYYSALNIIHNPRYRNAMYENPCKNGFAFIGQQSGSNKYMKFYDKGKELHRSCNKRFVETVGISNLTSYFQDVIRIEFRTITHGQVRTYSGIDSNNLQSLLLSDDNPLYKIFCEILRGNSMKRDEALLLDNISTIKDVDAILQQFGCSQWLNMFGNDLSSALSPIKQAIQATMPHTSNRSRKFKIYKDMFQTTLRRGALISDGNYINDYITEIGEFLKIENIWAGSNNYSTRTIKK